MALSLNYTYIERVFCMSTRSFLKKYGKRVNSAAQILVVICCIIFLINIVSTEATIAEKQQELNNLKSQEETLTEANGEYERILNEDDMNQYTLSLAVGNMGYSYPDEIRFYDTSRN